MEPIRITADILRNISMTMPLITQHDSGREIVITVKQDGQDIPLDNDIVYTITSRRDDGETFLSSPGVKTNVNEVTFRLGSSEVEKIGNVNASIQMYIDGLRVSTLRFGYKVVEDLSVNYIPSEDEQTLIEMVLYEGPEIMRAAQEATELALEAAEIANSSKGEKGDTGERGPQGEIGPEGPKGDTGLQGEQGDRGEVGPKGDTGERGPQGDPGPKGDDGDVGPRGEKGEQGTGLSIVGKLDSEDELPESGASGEAYLIKGDIYVWDGDFWTNMGSIQGPQGESGAKGEDGEQGPKGDPFLYSDFTPEQLEGLKGPQGDVGPKGEDGVGSITSVNNIDPDSSGNVTISIPSSTSQLTNDSNYATQEYVDNKEVDVSGLATKQEVAIHLAEYTQQLGTEELQTADKTLKGAINEVFQTGNNVKSDTVDALLSVDESLPVTSEDSWVNVIGSIGQISTGIVSEITAGDYIIYQESSSVSTISTSYTTLKTFKILKSGNYRITFDLKITDSRSAANGILHVNDSPVGIERSTTLSYPTAYTEDLKLTENDLLQLKLRRTASYGSVESIEYRMGIMLPDLVTKDI